MNPTYVFHEFWKGNLHIYIPDKFSKLYNSNQFDFNMIYCQWVMTTAMPMTVLMIITGPQAQDQ
jgi:hypothetical protein